MPSGAKSVQPPPQRQHFFLSLACERTRSEDSHLTSRVWQLPNRFPYPPAGNESARKVLRPSRSPVTNLPGRQPDSRLHLGARKPDRVSLLDLEKVHKFPSGLLRGRQNPNPGQFPPIAFHNVLAGLLSKLPDSTVFTVSYTHLTLPTNREV